MSYYADLFLRPKQAVIYALQNPSLVRSLAFVLLGTLAGVLASLLFMGTIVLDVLITFFLGDVLRWLSGGIILLLIGFLFKKIPLNVVNASRALSTLAQLNVYGFFMFLVLGLILPAITIPNLISATNDLSNGVIGEEEFSVILLESIASTGDAAILALPFILVGILLIFYGMYVLFLSIQKYLDTSVFKTILVWIVFVLVQGFILVLVA
jgi:hypothetical protein